MSIGFSWVDGFNNRMEFEFFSSSTPTNHPVKIILNNSIMNYSDIDSKSYALTYYNQTSDSEQQLYLVQQKWDESGNSIIRFKGPEVNATSYYLYFNNYSEVDSSWFNFNEVLEDFEDFEGTSLNTSIWNISDSPTRNVNNGMLEIYTTEENRGIRSTKVYPPNKIVLFEAKFPNEGIYYSLIGMQREGEYNHLHINGIGHYGSLLSYGLYTRRGGDPTFTEFSNTNRGVFHTFELDIQGGTKTIANKINNNDIIESTTSILSENSKIVLYYGQGDINHAVQIKWIGVTDRTNSDVAYTTKPVETKDYFGFSTIEETKEINQNLTIKIKNNGDEPATNVMITPNIGTLSESTFILIGKGETKEIQLSHGLTEPQIKNIILNITSDRINQTIDQVVAFYKQTDHQTTATIIVNDSGETELVNNNFTIELENQGFSDYNLNDFKYSAVQPMSTCYENGLPLQTNDYADYFTINSILQAGSSKTINCLLSSAENIFTENAEEQDITKTTNSTLAYTRIPLVFTNTYTEELPITWEYSKTGVNERTESETNGTITLATGETITKYLRMNRSINISLLSIKNYSMGTINPANNYLETYALMEISNNDSINYTDISFNYENDSYFEPVTSIRADTGITLQFTPIKISINKTEEEKGNLNSFAYSKNRLITMNHSSGFHISNLTFEYLKGNWESFKIYKCNFNNVSQCNLSNISDWETKDYQEDNGNILVKNNNMSDLIYLISYKNKQTPQPSPVGGGGGGGSAPTPFEITVETQIEETTLSINVSSTKYTKCDYSIDENEFAKMDGEKYAWSKSIELEQGTYNLFIRCTYNSETLYENKTITIKGQKENNSITSEPTQKDEDLIHDEPIIETAGITGWSIGAGNWWIGLIVLFLALASFYVYQKRDEISEIKAPKMSKISLPKIKAPRIVLPSIKKPNIKLRRTKPIKKIQQVEIKKQESLPMILDNKKINIDRKQIEEATDSDKPLGLQRICQYMQNDGKKLNYTITELANLLNLSQVSVRTAVNRGLKLGVFEKYEHGKFKAYRLGKYGRKVADLETEIKTYSELETVLDLLKKRN